MLAVPELLQCVLCLLLSASMQAVVLRFIHALLSSSFCTLILRPAALFIHSPVG